MSKQPLNRKMPRSGETRFGKNETDRKTDKLTVRVTQLENEVASLKTKVSNLDELERKIKLLESKVV